MFYDAAIACDPKGYKGVAGACECDTGYTGAVNYVNGKPVGCTGTCKQTWCQEISPCLHGV